MCGQYDWVLLMVAPQGACSFVASEISILPSWGLVSSFPLWVPLVVLSLPQAFYRRRAPHRRCTHPGWLRPPASPVGVVCWVPLGNGEAACVTPSATRSNCFELKVRRASLVTQLVKNLLAMQETWV